MQLSKQERAILKTLSEELETADKPTITLIAKMLKSMAEDE